MNETNTIYGFKVEGIDGNDIDFALFRQKKILIVNVASACGYTPQYGQLQELYDNFKDKLVIVGFPCNDFGGQEPGSDEAIYDFCTSNFGVGFPMAAKINIKGPDAHPIYQWLTKKEFNGLSNFEVAWNFHKFLLDENGRLIKALPSAVTPFDDEILHWVNGSL